MHEQLISYFPIAENRNPIDEWNKIHWYLDKWNKYTNLRIIAWTQVKMINFKIKLHSLNREMKTEFQWNWGFSSESNQFLAIAIKIKPMKVNVFPQRKHHLWRSQKHFRVVYSILFTQALESEDVNARCVDYSDRNSIVAWYDSLFVHYNVCDSFRIGINGRIQPKYTRQLYKYKLDKFS